MKKFLPVFLILTALIVILTSCGNSKYKEYAGTWVCSSCEVNGVESDMSVFGGHTPVIELGEDGKATFSQSNDNEESGEWERDGESIILSLDNRYTLTVDGDSLRLTLLSSIKCTFRRGEVESETQVSSKESKDKVTPEAKISESVKLAYKDIAPYSGDWYGTLYIRNAGGKLAALKGNSADMFARFAIEQNGIGDVYTAVNGSGDQLFNNCVIYVSEGKLHIDGYFLDEPIEWVLSVEEGLCTLKENYTTGGDDFAAIEIYLRRKGADWSNDAITPPAINYIEVYGYNGFLEKIGGSEAMLPTLPLLSEEVDSFIQWKGNWEGIAFGDQYGYRNETIDGMVVKKLVNLSLNDDNVAILDEFDEVITGEWKLSGDGIELTFGERVYTAVFTNGELVMSESITAVYFFRYAG